MCSRAVRTPSLLRSYSAERWVEAKRLVDTDHDWARIMSAPPGKSELDGDREPALREAVQREPRIHRRARGAVRRSALIGRADPPGAGDGRGGRAAVPFGAGGAGVGCQADAARPRGGGRRALADLRLRRDGSRRPLHALADWLETDPASPVRKYTRADEDIDGLIDLRAVFQETFDGVAYEDMSGLLKPTKGQTRAAGPREGLLRRSQGPGRHLRDARDRPGDGAAWWWCVPTSISPTCCRWTASMSWRRSSTGFCCPPGELPGARG